MSTDYRPLTEIPFDEIFDGRLEKYGIDQVNKEIQFIPPRYLIAGDEILEVYRKWDGNTLFQRPPFKPVPTTILNAIAAEFQTELIDEHDHRYWGFATVEEWSNSIATMAGQDEDEFYHDALRFCRDELNHLKPGTIGYAKAEIARELIDQNPYLANPENRGALLLAINDTYEQRHSAATIHLTDEDLANPDLMIARTSSDAVRSENQQDLGQALSAGPRLSVSEWLQIRKHAAAKIDPKTAEIGWHWDYVTDPYGLNPNLPDELKLVGRVYFARSPGSEIWVSFYDLPDDVRCALYASVDVGQ